MDERYIEKLFGDNYHGFDYEEAVKSVGVSDFVFYSRIHNLNGKPKLSKDIDLEAIYTFTLFCYYHWCAHPCRVLIVPDFFKYLQLLIGYYKIEKIAVLGKPIKMNEGRRKLKRSDSVEFTCNQHVNIPQLFIDYMRSPDVVRSTMGRFFDSFDLKQAEARNIRDYIDKRTISAKIATKLSKLFVCLFGLDNETPQRRRDIMNILSAFDLTQFKKDSNLLDNYKQLNRADVAPLYYISQKTVYLNSGEDHFLIEYTEETKTEIVNYILNQMESIRL